MTTRRRTRSGEAHGCDGNQAHAVPMSEKGGALEVLEVSTRLGLTSIGGPIAHLGYFHAEGVLPSNRWHTSISDDDNAIRYW